MKPNEQKEKAPLLENTYFLAPNIQIPSPTKTSHLKDESLVIHPITPTFCQPNRAKLTIASNNFSKFDSQGDQQDDDMWNAALLLTNVGMLMAKEVNCSMFMEKDSPVLPNLNDPYSWSGSKSHFCSNVNSDNQSIYSDGSFVFSPTSSPRSINTSISFTKNECDSKNIDCQQILSNVQISNDVKESSKKDPQNISSYSNRVRAVSMDSHLNILDSPNSFIRNMNVHQDSEKIVIDLPNQIKKNNRINAMTTPCVSPPTSPIAINVTKQDKDFENLPITMKVGKELSPNRSARLADRRKRYLDSSLVEEGEALQENKHCNQLRGGMNRSQDGNFTHDINTPKIKKLHNNTDDKPTSSLKSILRKKFSWKNYPVLEAFLIANRSEYLRHSALNYTMQQKNYNNRLTERLLQVASDNGYIFDEEVFSFATVRDRIRCYFKSYVQSRKKRGVIIGYAARRAGLMSKKEIEESAGKKGQIIMPHLYYSQQQPHK